MRVYRPILLFAAFLMSACAAEEATPEGAAQPGITPPTSDVGAAPGSTGEATADAGVDAGPEDAGPVATYPRIQCACAPACVGCSQTHDPTGMPEGWQHSIALVCPIDGYCDCDEEGRPEIHCCDEPCDGAAGGAGAATGNENFVTVKPEFADQIEPGCEEIQMTLRSWTHGHAKPLPQVAEARILSREGKLCTVAFILMSVEGYPDGCDRPVFENVAEATTSCSQQDKKVRQAFAHWFDERYCDRALDEGGCTAPGMPGYLWP